MLAPPAPANSFASNGDEPAASQDLVRQSRSIVGHLQKSELFPAYVNAFRGATGLPLALRSLGSFHSSLLGAKNANPFCRLLAANNRSCAACLRLQQRVEEASLDGAATLECFAGLSESAVPIRVGDQVVAFLQTGQVFLRRPSRRRFHRTVGRLKELGAVLDWAQLEAAYFATPVIPPGRYRSILRLLALTADHLSQLTNQLMVQQEWAGLPAVARARAYIAQHQTERISLGEVAKAAKMSTFYFCKIFHKESGLTFGDYLARLRIENVKELLLHPHRRISEAAFAAGFQSLSQFNRVFRRIAGQSPTAYRRRLHANAA
jgi:AraC-like DNA-binding protein